MSNEKGRLEQALITCLRQRQEEKNPLNSRGNQVGSGHSGLLGKP